MILLTVLLWIVTIAVLIVTVLPMTGSVRWWVRAWEFPRLHIALIATLCLIAVLLLPISSQVVPLLLLLACAVYQFSRVYPYTPLAPSEVAMVKDDGNAIKLLAANVLMENTRKTDLLRIVEREDPDVLFLMETDQKWLDAFHDCLARYPTVLRYPMDNHYGLIFATRLDTQNAQTVFLADDNTPALCAEMTDPTGKGFNFIGLHPRPPVPGNTTKERDEQIKKAAQLTGNADLPTICMGDFNDVAWSWTSKRFKRYGGFLEPRVGRGMFSTFHAQYPLISVPIDQFYVTSGIGLVSFGRLENFGSDHYPISAVVTVKDS